ncbi:MAG: DnaD domain protein [Chloroflexi bacterium]|nr:DnaD domain protein [Chloroflexota bacterium]
MRACPGFPDRPAVTRVPTEWLCGALAETESLAELKVTLHVLRLLDAKRTAPRFVRLSELRADPAARRSWQACGGLSADAALSEGVRLAVARGVLLALPVRIEGDAARAAGGTAGEDTCLFLNTPATRRLVARVQRGEVALVLAPTTTVTPAATRRLTIFELYEQNIGLLTPLLVEELREAAETYPPEWIEEAFREAVGYNRRHWRYVRRILDHWATQGRGERGAAGRRPEAPRDPRRYLEGEYGHLIQH